MQNLDALPPKDNSFPSENTFSWYFCILARVPARKQGYLAKLGFAKNPGQSYFI